MPQSVSYQAVGFRSGNSYANSLRQRIRSELVTVRDIMATVNITAMIYILATVFICQCIVSDKKKTNSEIF
jgi:hypothetical protein